MHDGPDRRRDPGEPYTFTTLKNAQAIGDLQTLRELGLPAERVRLRGEDPVRRCAHSPQDASDQGACCDADRFRRAGQDGREHGSPHPPRLRARGGRVRLRREGRQAGGQERRVRRRLAEGSGQAAARRRGWCGSWCRRANPPSRRSTSSPSCSTAATRSSTAATRSWTDDKRRAKALKKQRHRLRRRRRLRRRVGAGSRLLHDGRRPAESGQAARADPRRARARDQRAEPSPRSARAAGCASARPGAGHYVKMVHNGVEYGLMQAYAEGFDVFDKCEYELDNAQIAHLWGQGSVVRSWLCELAARAFEADGNDLRSDRGLHRGLRRGPLDDRRRHRPRRADAGDHRVAVRALALARQRRLRRSRAGGAAQPVRRPRGQERARSAKQTAERQAGQGRAQARRWRGERDDERDRAAEPRTRSSAGLERLPVAPTTLVIFGATGDLARRKLLPALYNLAHDGALPERFHLVGVSRKEKEHEDYRDECEQAIRQLLAPHSPTRTCCRRLLENVRYVPGTFDDDAVYAELSGRCSTTSTSRPGERLQPRLLPVDGARASSR